MGKAIGFRVTRARVYYGVVEGSAEEPVLVDDGSFSAPSGYAEPESLTRYRRRTLALINEHEPEYGGMKLMESVGYRGRPPTVSDSILERHRIEGVILEAMHDANLTIFTGRYRSVGSQLGAESAREYVEAGELRGIDLSSIARREVQEAILAATAALAG